VSSDIPKADLKLVLKAELMSFRARRKILDWKIDQAMRNIERWESERSHVSDQEDSIVDEIDRRRI